MFNRMQEIRLIICGCAISLVLGGCLGIPEGTRPVTGFDLQQYLGKWYEIARMDHSFERGLSSVTAEYVLREDGGVRVLNRGFESKNGKWKEAEGKAYFVDDPSVGQLKVSFFGPFYASYNVIALDKQAYQWAMVVGPDTSYMWILSRTPDLDKAVVDQLIAQARSYGFKTEDLIFVDQDNG